MNGIRLPMDVGDKLLKGVYIRVGQYNSSLKLFKSIVKFINPHKRLACDILDAIVLPSILHSITREESGGGSRLCSFVWEAMTV